MEAEQTVEWIEVRDQAIGHLRSRDYISRRRYDPLVQFLMLPSFADAKAVDVLRTNDRLVAFATYWHHDSDIQAFCSPVERLKHPRPFVPTFESIPIEIESETLDQLLGLIATTHISLKPQSSSVALDGVSYELRFGAGLVYTHLRWHNSIPADWSSLSPIVEKFMSMLPQS